MKKPVFGLIGSISRDEITYQDGRTFRQLGGILYQAATLCGLGEDTYLFANLAEGMAAEVEAMTAGWSTLRRDGIRRVPGSGNVVHLFYPEKGERREILDSVVPALEPERVIRALPELDLLVMVVNSGFDMTLESWRAVAAAATCPIWFDIHSLTLAKVFAQPRAYRAIPEWKEWVKGAACLQANRKEIACMLGRPNEPVLKRDIEAVGTEAFSRGLPAMFVTLGKLGGLVLTPGGVWQVGKVDEGRPVDTTGCGDVFAAAAASRLVRHEDPKAVGTFGINLASRAAFAAGVQETYELVRGIQK